MSDELDQWEETYRPIKNSFVDSASWNNTMFETYGEELAFIDEQPNENVWTWVDGDDGTYIVAGRAFVNRIGYFVTEVPWTNEAQYVQVEQNEEEWA